MPIEANVVSANESYVGIYGERSEPALSEARRVGGPGACPRRRTTAGVGGLDI